MNASWEPVRIVEADELQAATDAHVFDSELGTHVFVVEGSRLYDVDMALREALEQALRQGQSIDAVLGVPPMSLPKPAHAPKIRALSLAVSQSCNLSCGYCYAKGGDFGAGAKQMSWDVAANAIEGLLAELCAGERANLAFMGGEPLANRDIVHRATALAREIAARRRIRLGFSITTNGTLLTEDDIALFNRNRFAVTVSLDGAKETHDTLRPFKNGRGSYARIVNRCRALLAQPRHTQVHARVTVTPRNLDLRSTLTDLAALGFDSVGFSPMLRSPNGAFEMDRVDLSRFLDEMVACSDVFETHLASGSIVPFSNVITAITEIHRGAQKTHPCGAGLGYLGVSADGGLYACHRFVEDPRGALGDLASGLDAVRYADWREARHVSRQAPCRRCWARHLCGGGCHHEVMDRQRIACDFVRGWLEHCLRLYVRLQSRHPNMFSRLLETAA